MRRRVFLLLDAEQEQLPISKAVDCVLIGLISLNVMDVMVVSMPGVYDAHKTLFDHFKIFSVIFFTIEYLFRVWSSVESHNSRFNFPIKGHLRYMLTPLALIDLIVILPFYVSAFVGVDLRMLHALRLTDPLYKVDESASTSTSR